jgi:hypothetical protein
MMASLRIDEIHENWNRIKDLWCFLMHNEATWPINGHYQCRRCHHIYRVPWNNN